MGVCSYEFCYFLSFKFSPLWDHKFSFSRPERHSGFSTMRAGVTNCLEGFSEQKTFSFKARTVQSLE